MTLAADLCRATLTPHALMDFVGDVSRGMLLSGVVGLYLSGTDPGSSRVILLSLKHYLLRMTSSAANKRTVSKVNMASVRILLLTGACSAGK